MSDDEPSRDELEQRVDRLEGLVQKMMPSRRDVIKGGGMAALGAVGMYSATGGAQAQQAAGQVGTESEPVDLEAASVNGSEARFTPSSASTDAGTNVSKPSPVIIRGSDQAAGLILQNQDDSVSNGAGRANIYWYSDSGSNLAAVTAHPSDNEFSVYTKTGAVDSGAGLTKRLDISGGAGNTQAIWQGDGSVEHKFVPTSGNDSRITWLSDPNTTEATLKYDSATGNMQFVDGDGSIIWQYNGAAGPNGQYFHDDNPVIYSTQDVRNLGDVIGATAFHDGSGSNTVGPAHHNGTNWISTVDGSTIS